MLLEVGGAALLVTAEEGMKRHKQPVQTVMR
jgi:hypothetical protein